MKLYEWSDRLIVAEDEMDARGILREDLGVKPTRQCPLSLVEHNVDLQRHDKNANIETRSYTPVEAVAACGRGMAPEGE